MQKLTFTELMNLTLTGEESFYLASYVDAEIDALKHDIERHIAITTEQANRIAELERLLREAHHFAGEDFRSDVDYSALTPKDVAVTPRYLKYWQDLNKALMEK